MCSFTAWGKSGGKCPVFQSGMLALRYLYHRFLAMAPQFEAGREEWTLGDQCQQVTTEVAGMQLKSTSVLVNDVNVPLSGHKKRNVVVRAMARRRKRQALRGPISRFPSHLDFSVNRFDMMVMGFENHIDLFESAIESVSKDLVRQDPYLFLKDLHRDLAYESEMTTVRDRLKVIELMLHGLFPMDRSEVYRLCSDVRLWSECKPWFVAFVIRVLLDNERIYMPDGWGCYSPDTALQSGDDVLAPRPTYSRVAAKPVPVPLVPRVHPHIKVANLTRDDKRKLVRCAEVEGLVCKWCGVVNFPKYGHLPLCMRPLSIPYSSVGLYENRHLIEPVDLHAFGIGLTSPTLRTIDGLKNITHHVQAPEIVQAVSDLKDINVNVNVGFMNPFAGIGDQVTKLFQTFKSALGHLPDIFMWIIRKVPLLALWLYQQVTQTLPNYVVAALKALWGSDPPTFGDEVVQTTEFDPDHIDRSDDVFSYSLDDLENEMGDDEDVCLHAGSEDLLFVAGMSFILFPALRDFTTKKDLKKLIASLVVMPKLIGSWADFSEWFCEKFLSVLSQIMEKFGVDIKCKRKVLAQVQNFHDHAVKFCSNIHTGLVDPTLETAREYQRLEMQGCDLYVKHNAEPDMRKVLAHAIRELRQVGCLLASYAPSSQGMRVAPSVVAIAGDPGIGKSVMLPVFCTDVLARRIPKYRFDAMGGNLDAEIYTHDGGRFWNAYHGQELMLMDDAFQKNVVKGMPEDEYNEFIKLVSNAPKPLDKADLMSKGKFHFCSNGIVMTTNNDNMAPHIMQVCCSTDAVKRRFVGYEFVLKPEWRDKVSGHLNYAKFTEYVADPTPREYCTPDAWDVYLVDLVNKKTLDAEAREACKLPRGIFDVIDRFVGTMTKFERGFDELSVAVKQWATTKYREQVQLQGPTTLRKALVATGVGFGLGVWAETEYALAKLEGDPEPIKNFLRRKRGQLESLAAHPLILYSAAIALAIPVIGALISGVNYLFRVLFTGGDNQRRVKTNKSTYAALASTRKWMIENLVDEDFRVPDTNIVEVGPHVLKNAYNRLVPADMHACSLVRQVDEDLVYLGGEIDNSQMVTSIVNIVEMNSYHLKVVGESGVVPYGNVLFVSGRAAIFNKHFVILLRKRDPADRVVLTSAFNRTQEYLTTVGDFLSCVRGVSQETDLACADCVFARMHRDLAPFTLTREQCRSIGSARVALVVNNSGRRVKHFTRAVYDHSVVGHSVIGCYRDVWCYSAKTEFGDCGSVLVMTHNPQKQNHRFLGFHMGLSQLTMTSLAVSVTTEVVDYVKRVCGVVDVADSEVKLHSVQLEVQDDQVPLPGAFLPYRRVVGQFHPMASVSAKIPIKPMMHALSHVHTQTRKPAYLRPFKTLNGVRIDPHDNAYAKLAPPIPWKHKPLLFRAVERVTTHLRTTVPNHGVGVLSPMQALEGVRVPGCRLEPINRSSGPGFPYCLTGSDVKSKRLMTAGPDGVSYELSADLVERLETIVQEAKCGRRCEHVYVDFLKDELRPIEKADEGKSRLISSCPLDLTLVTRMYFGAFVGAMMAYCGPNCDTRITVGINPFEHWDTLVRQVMDKGGDSTLDCPVIAGDFSGFDATEIPEVHEHILNIINAWYDDGPENALVRRVLWMEVMQSRHLTVGVDGLRNVIVEWIRSLPSGHPLTSLINSIYNMIAFVYCFMKRVPEPEFDFFRNTKIFFYGDDNWGSVDPVLRGRFNQRTIQEDALDFGLKYTDDSKSGEVAEWQRMGDTQFLKRTAWYDEINDRWFGALDINSAIEICCWTRSLEEKFVEQNVERTMYELSYSPLSTWNKYAPAVTTAVRECFPAIPAPGFGMDAYNFWRERARQYGCHF